MIDNICNTIKSDLLRDVGLQSSYTDDRIESIQTRLPETVSVNKFIGIVPSDESPIQYEIGQQLPTIWIYNVNVVILIKDMDYASGLTRLAKVTRRVKKSFAKTSTLKQQSDTTDNMTETIVDYSITRVDFESGRMPSDKNFNHVAVMTVQVKTTLDY